MEFDTKVLGVDEYIQFKHDNKVVPDNEVVCLYGQDNGKLITSIYGPGIDLTANPIGFNSYAKLEIIGLSKDNLVSIVRSLLDKLDLDLVVDHVKNMNDKEYRGIEKEEMMISTHEYGILFFKDSASIEDRRTMYKAIFQDIFPKLK